MNKVRLGDVCQVVSGSTPKSSNSEYWGGPFNWVTPAELSDSTLFVLDTERKITQKGIDSCALTLMPVGTVLLSSRAPIGKVAITGVEMYCNQGFKNLICSDKINNHYLYWFLKAKKQYLNSLGRGATFKEISKTIYENIEIPYPSIEQQIQIASILFKINETITLCGLLITKMDELIKSRFVEMFGDPNDNSNTYGNHVLSDVCNSIVRGPFGSALKKEFFVPKSLDTYKVYEQKHSIQKDATIGTYYVSKEKFLELKRFECHAGDILMSCSGTMGELYQLPDCCEKGLINQALCKFTLNEKILPIVFLEFMKSTIKNIESKGSGIKNIAAVSYVKAMPMIIPPIELQHKYADFVTQVEKQKATVQQSIDKLETLKKSLMQEYFG